jgi:hypothetical protein
MLSYEFKSFALLLQYRGKFLANIPEASTERSATLVVSYQPDADLTAFMERYRTSPLRPVPQLRESALHDESDVVFGIYLRKWVGTHFEFLLARKRRH